MRRHDLDVFSLVCGLFLILVAGVWGLADLNLVTPRTWPLPALLIVVGLVGVVASLGGRRHGEADDPPDADGSYLPHPDLDE